MFLKPENVRLDLSVILSLIEQLKVSEQKLIQLQVAKAPVTDLAVALAEVNGLLAFIADETKAVTTESKAIYNLTYAEQKAGGNRSNTDDLLALPKSKKIFD